MAISIKPKAPATLKEALVKALSNTIKLALGLALGALFVHWFTGGQSYIVTQPQLPTPGQEALVDRALVKGSPGYVLDQHRDDCWTMEQAPKAELPGAAIIQFTDGHTVYVKNTTPRGFKLVDAAFNEALAIAGFGDKYSERIDVVALCK